MRYLIPFILLWLSACASVAPPFKPADDAAFERWFNDELTPYLTQQLSRHPHFQGKSVLLVKLDEQDISPRIDAFTDQLRTRLFDSLMQTPGVNLYWRPAERVFQHHRRLADLQCSVLQDLAVYLGLDARLLPDGQGRVAVRALDRQAGQWVSGFGKSWQGRLSAEHQQALQHSSPDAYLRGLRPLPFAADQADLNAEYLARNLACLLQQTGLPKLIVHFAPLQANTTQYFHTLSELLSHYLAQFQEVAISETAAGSTVSITQDVRMIDGQGLHQHWLIPTWLDKGIRLSGTTTVSYARLSSHMSAALPESTVQLSQDFRPKQVLIHAFDLVAPTQSEDCNGPVYWDRGMKAVADGALLTSGACFGLRLNLQQAATVVLLQQDGLGRWKRLHPRCSQSTMSWRLPAMQTQRFPGGNTSVLSKYVLDDQPGTERFYVLATTSEAVSTQLQRYAKAIPDDCANAWHQANGAGERLLQWAAEQSAVEWRSVFIQHIAGLQTSFESRLNSTASPYEALPDPISGAWRFGLSQSFLRATTKQLENDHD